VVLVIMQLQEMEQVAVSMPHLLVVVEVLLHMQSILIILGTVLKLVLMVLLVVVELVELLKLQQMLAVQVNHH
jgi:hypothetical protein